MIKEDLFIEYNFHFGNYYGTSKGEIERIIKLKKIPVLDIDINGTMNVQKCGKFQRIVAIFIIVSDMENL